MSTTPTTTVPAWAAHVEPWEPAGVSASVRRLRSEMVTGGPLATVWLERFDTHTDAYGLNRGTVDLCGAITGSFTGDGAELAQHLDDLAAALTRLAATVRGDLP